MQTLLTFSFLSYLLAIQNSVFFSAIFPCDSYIFWGFFFLITCETYILFYSTFFVCHSISFFFSFYFACDFNLHFLFWLLSLQSLHPFLFNHIFLLFVIKFYTFPLFSSASMTLYFIFLNESTLHYSDFLLYNWGILITFLFIYLFFLSKEKVFFLLKHLKNDFNTYVILDKRNWLVWKNNENILQFFYCFNWFHKKYVIF